MTKYVVNSGGIRSDPAKAGMFFKEIVNGLGASPKVLLCQFAMSREYWEIKFTEDMNGFLQHMEPDVKPVFEMAMPAEFERQLDECDAIYMCGGDDHLMKYWLSRFDLKQLFAGKTVGTNSASSNAVSQSYWTCDWREVQIGLGLLPMKFISHYNSSFGDDDPRGPIDWPAAKVELEEHGNKDLRVLALEEASYEVFKTDD